MIDVPALDPSLRFGPGRADAVAIVSGGGGGIGAATCRQLSALGWTVLVGHRTDPSGAREVVADCAGKAEAVPLDVTDQAQVDAAIARAGDLGTLGLVVNNAGVSHDDLLLRATLDDLDATLDVNLRGAWRLTKAALRPMLRAREGRIIQVSSVVALRGNPGQTAYAASKAALIGMSRALAQEVGRKGVTVNVVAPGLVETAMTAALPDAARDALRDAAPIGRAVTAEEVAAAVAWLASPLAAGVTGAVIPVDGGASC